VAMPRCSIFGLAKQDQAAETEATNVDTLTEPGSAISLHSLSDRFIRLTCVVWSI
jgi:hypothetical protein